MLITERDAAQYLGMSISWMQRMRWKGGGPPYIKIHHAVRYRQADLEAWIESRVQSSTTQTSHQEE